MPDVPLPPPWDACAASFLQSIYDHSGSRDSLENYTYTLRAFFRDASRAPDAYTRTEVEAFLGGRSQSNRNKGAPVTASTRNSRLKILNSFYRYSANYYVDGAPLLKTAPPTYGLKYLRAQVAPRAMNEDELRRFFGAIDTNSTKGLRDKALFLFYWWTGRRRSEVQRLTWGDLEHAVIVEPNGTRRNGIVYRYIAKGRSREVQTAELPEPAYRALETYLRAAGRLEDMQPGDPLFTAMQPGQGRKDKRGNLALRGEHINTLMKEYCRKAGLSPTFSLHSLRHTGASLRHQNGSTLQDIQQWLGHSSIATTDIYLRRVTGVADPGAKLLEARYGDL